MAFLFWECGKIVVWPLALTVYVCGSHFCDTLGGPPTLHLNVVLLGTVILVLADVGLNPDDKG
jgi:hypothetical protein